MNDQKEARKTPGKDHRGIYIILGRDNGETLYPEQKGKQAGAKGTRKRHYLCRERGPDSSQGTQ